MSTAANAVLGAVYMRSLGAHGGRGVADGRDLALQNAGVAPVYRPYVLALQLHGARDATIELPVDVRKWLPGDELVEEKISIPDLPAGEYRLRVAMLDARSRKPAIQFGTAGRAPDGWYDLGGIAIRKL